MLVYMPKLRIIRRMAKISGNALARKAGIDRGTVSNAENGGKITYNSALKIIKALNSIYKDNGYIDTISADTYIEPTEPPSTGRPIKTR